MKNRAKKKNMRLNVALLPDKKSFEKAVSISKMLNKYYNVHFTLERKKYLPHLSLYLAVYPRKLLNNIQAITKQIASKSNSSNLSFKNIQTHRNYLLINFEENKWIKDLHRKTVAKLNPLREGLVRKKYIKKEYRKKQPQNIIRNIDKYGYPYVLSNYQPHFTITKFKGPFNPRKVIKQVNWNISTTNFEKIALCKVGPKGTCMKIIKQFRMEK